MGIQGIVREKRAEILRLAAEHGAKRVRVFGSVARGEADDESDIDFLVEFEPGRTLLDHAALVRELRSLLGRQVDVVSERGLRERVRDRVMEEAIAV